MNAVRFRQLRYARIDSFSTALVVSLGLSACGSKVQVEDGDSGGGGGLAGGSAGGGSSVGGSSVGGSSVGGGAVGGAGGGTIDVACENPVPVVVNGVDTGFDRCEGGQYRRRTPELCPAAPQDPNSCCGLCAEGEICSTAGEVACSCVPSCGSDADCDGGLCLCTEGGGTCVPTSCFTTAECGPNQECTSWDASQGCLYLEFACTTAQDTCGGDNDCTVIGEMCVRDLNTGVRSCQPGGCAIGRPFLVQGSERVAPLLHSSDWNSPREQPEVACFTQDERRTLAERWSFIGQMEHASVGAFARFSLQLLSLGAPAVLLAQTQAAMGDELRHAQSAFALASAFSGNEVGPGKLDVARSLEDSDRRSIVRLTIREGCVGESVAALEAAEGESLAADPVVRRVLAQVAADEAAHARLAWFTLRWAMTQFGGEVHEVLAEEVARLELELATDQAEAVVPCVELVPGSGLLSLGEQLRHRRAVIERAVLPALRGLLAQPRPTAEVQAPFA